jgi:hypothetical protein
MVALALVCAMWPSAAHGAPVEVTAFSLSPPCVAPGGTVTADTTVRNTTLLPQRFYAQTRASYYGYPVATSQVYGPYDLPPLASTGTRTQMDVPLTAPWGWYTVVFGIGPSTGDAMGWSTRSAGVKVAPPPVC